MIARAGVGYSVEKNAKEGCLRLYGAIAKPIRITQVLCLDKSGRWWSKEDDDDKSPVRLGLRLRD